MNNINQHIENQATEYCSDYDPKGDYYQYSQTAIKFAFINGAKEFDKLELPIKFITWCADNGWYRNGKIDEWYQIPKQNENKTIKELYNYWLENIYEYE